VVADASACQTVPPPTAVVTVPPWRSNVIVPPVAEAQIGPYGLFGSAQGACLRTEPVNGSAVRYVQVAVTEPSRWRTTLRMNSMRFQP
jgi:hypothetical protein